MSNNRTAEPPLVFSVIDLIVWIALMVGSLAGAFIMIPELPWLGFPAFMFAFGYMAWQFENAGRIREYRLITGSRRPMPFRNGPINWLAHVLRAVLIVYAGWAITDNLVAIYVITLVAVLMAFEQAFSRPLVAMLIDAHEQSYRTRRVRKLVQAGHQDATKKEAKE